MIFSTNSQIGINHTFDTQYTAWAFKKAFMTDKAILTSVSIAISPGKKCQLMKKSVNYCLA
jgi:hypothetical protein